MNSVKYCERCLEEYGRQTVIAREDECDWYSFVRIKYCPECRERMRRMQNRINKRKSRAGFRQQKKEMKTEIELLREQTEIMRDTIEKYAQENAALRNRLADMGVRFAD